MLSHVGFSARTVIGSCSAVADFVTRGFPALFGAVCFTSGELGLFVRGFLDAAVFVAQIPGVVDRVEAFALIALIAGGGVGDGPGGVLVRVEARVAGADGFARPVMVQDKSRRVVPRDLLILSHSSRLQLEDAPNPRSVPSLLRRQAPCIRPSRRASLTARCWPTTHITTEDTFLLLDSLESDVEQLKTQKPLICLEIG